MPKEGRSLDIEDIDTGSRAAVDDVRRVDVKAHDLTTEASHCQNIRLQDKKAYTSKNR